MKKILVIGCPGSGKSTFARRLRDRTGLPLYPLDLLWHRPDKTTVSEAEFDAVFLFDLPLADCIAGVEARIGTKREDMPWIETEFDPEFREFITHFSETRLPNIYALLEKHRDKTLTVFHSRAECEVYKIPAAEA